MSVEAPYFARYAPALLAKGWGVFPATCGKATDIPWREFQRRQPRLLEMMRWVDDLPTSAVALPFGPVNDDVIGLDVDEDDPLKAAGTDEAIVELAGRSPVVRMGRWPRTLRLYRAPRMRSQTIGSVQILARGHYGVMYGRHPSTGEPYQQVGELELADVRPGELPLLSAVALRQLRAELGPGRTHLPRTLPKLGAIGMTLEEALRGVEIGRRHQAMLCIASSFRGRARTPEEAIAAVTAAARRCDPPYSTKKAIEVVRWAYARFPVGTLRFGVSDAPTVLQIAVRRATEEPFPMEGASELYRRFLGTCADLQRYQGLKPIALPQPALAPLLGCSPRGVGKLIAKAAGDGLLKVVCTTYRIGERAKTYRFLGNDGDEVPLT